MGRMREKTLAPSRTGAIALGGTSGEFEAAAMPRRGGPSLSVRLHLLLAGLLRFLLGHAGVLRALFGDAPLHVVFLARRLPLMRARRVGRTARAVTGRRRLVRRPRRALRRRCLGLTEHQATRAHTN